MFPDVSSVKHTGPEKTDPGPLSSSDVEGVRANFWLWRATAEKEGRGFHDDCHEFNVG